MIVSCRACSTRYLIDTTALGGKGRTVRCAKCNHTWQQLPPNDMPKKIDVLEPEDNIKPMPSGSNLPAIVNIQKKGRRLSWVGLLIIIFVIIFGGILARKPITDAWPPSTKFYSFLGLQINQSNVKELELTNILREEMVENGVTVIVIRGKIFNPSDMLQMIPAIRVSLVSSDDTELHQWTFITKQRNLDARSWTSFQTKLVDPAFPDASIHIGFVVEEKSRL